MRSVFVLLACAVLLTGCESFGDLTSDAYDPGSAPQSAFEQDSAGCQAKAELKRSYEVRGISGTHMERHEIFNRAYDACMRANGYARRGWAPNLPYEIDPTPG